VTPVLYSFRRCPYAIRARLALHVSAQRVELREILLRDKPAAFLDKSASATVPCLVLSDTVIDESLDIMTWALQRHDPEGWLDIPPPGWDLIAHNDGPFKQALDRTKYASRYPEAELPVQRQQAARFLAELDAQIDRWIFARPTIADFAILPFVRQFALIDKLWFDAQPWPRLQAWLEQFLASAQFANVMAKYPPWQPGDPPLHFP
jgi:glutathione S-transferase